MHNYLKVEGSDSLVRDISTHAIINNSSVEYDNYLKRKNSVLSQQNQIQQHSEDINNIKQELSEIKDLLLMLLKNKG